MFQTDMRQYFTFPLFIKNVKYFLMHLEKNFFD